MHGSGSISRGRLVLFLRVAHPLLVPVNIHLSLVAPQSCLHVATTITKVTALTGQLNQVRLANRPQTLGYLEKCLSQHGEVSSSSWAEKIYGCNSQEGESVMLCEVHRACYGTEVVLITTAANKSQVMIIFHTTGPGFRGWDSGSAPVQGLFHFKSLPTYTHIHCATDFKSCNDEGQVEITNGRYSPIQHAGNLGFGLLNSDLGKTVKERWSLNMECLNIHGQKELYETWEENSLHSKRTGTLLHR